MGTDAANLRSLRDVLRALVICIIGCALVAGIAIAMAEESGVRRSDSASAVACDGAAKLGTATESKAKAAVAMLERAGVNADNVGWLGGRCTTTWRTSNERAAGLADAVQVKQACARAAALLARGHLTEGRVALTQVGVNSDNRVWLEESCANTWNLAMPTALETAKPNADASELACKVARSQLNQGHESEAMATIQAVGAAGAATVGGCSDVWVLASGLAAASASGAKSGPETFGGSWDDFVTTFAAPLATLGAFVLGGWLALFVVARILVELSFVRNLSSSLGERRGAALLGWLVIAGAPMLAGLVAVNLVQGSIGWAWAAPALIAIALIGAIGAASLACWLATLRKLDLDVTPGDNGIDRVQILETIRKLATDTGTIELRSAPTLSDIDSALTDLSKAQWVAAVQKVALFLVGVKPWKAAVTVVSDREAYILMGRNGRSIVERRVWTDSPSLASLDPLPSGVDNGDILTVFIAAEILLAMQSAYPEDFRAGLNGATKARAVALQHIVHSWYMRRPTSLQAVELLELAVAIDPGDRLSAATLQSARYRKSDDPEELLRYSEWLSEAMASADVSAP
jgi:hypothetical protein